MKVLHVIPSLSAAHGGPTRALALMERALAAQGVEVETATTDDDGPGRRNGKRTGVPLLEEGATRWYFPKRLDFYKPAPAFGRWISAEARRYDLVHVHALFSYTSTVAARAAQRAGVPYVLRPLGTLNTYGISQRRPALKQLSLRWLEGPIIRAAAAVHFTSRDEAVQARQLGVPMREAMIPLGVPVPGEPGALVRRQHGQLLFLSRLDPKKNLEQLLEALALLRGEIPHLHLVVAGAGEASYTTALRQRAQSLGLAQQVSWLGHVEGRAKADALAAAETFVLPSLSENFGIAAAEALAAGLPCVLGAGVAIAQDVAEAGAGVAVEPTAAGIAAGVRRIMASQDTLRQMSDRARQVAQQNYSVDAMGVALKQLYLDILKR